MFIAGSGRGEYLAINIKLDPGDIRILKSGQTQNRQWNPVDQFQFVGSI
jgi:hypothetical protein